MVLRHKNDQYQCLWWQLAAYFVKNSAKNDWFFWLCSNVQTVHFQAQDDVKTISLEETITLYRAPPSVSPPQILQGHGQNFLAATPNTELPTIRQPKSTI